MGLGRYMGTGGAEAQPRQKTRRGTTNPAQQVPWTVSKAPRAGVAGPPAAPSTPATGNAPLPTPTQNRRGSFGDMLSSVNEPPPTGGVSDNPPMVVSPDAQPAVAPEPQPAVAVSENPPMVVSPDAAPAGGRTSSGQPPVPIGPGTALGIRSAINSGNLLTISQYLGSLGIGIGNFQAAGAQWMQQNSEALQTMLLEVSAGKRSWDDFTRFLGHGLAPTGATISLGPAKAPPPGGGGGPNPPPPPPPAPTPTGPSPRELELQQLQQYQGWQADPANRHTFMPFAQWREMMGLPNVNPTPAPTGGPTRRSNRGGIYTG